MGPVLRRHLLFFLSAAVLGAGGAHGADDAPRPSRRILSAQAMLEKRAEHLALLRGVPSSGTGNPRLAALKEMERSVGRRALAPSVWRPIGPAPIPNGQTVPSAAVSGRVTAIAVHPSDPDKVYVGTAQGGVFRTLDGGTTWIPIFDGALSLAIGALALDPGDPTRLLVGTGEANTSPDSFFGVGLYVVGNAETTATLSGPLGSDGTSDLLGGRSITRILVNPSDRNVVFLSTASGFGGVDGSAGVSLPDRGLYRSMNALSAAPTFTKIAVSSANGGNRAITDMVLEPGAPGHLLVSVFGADVPNDGGLYRTANALDPAPSFTRVLSYGSDFVRTSLAVQKTGGTVTVLALSSEMPPGTCAAAGEGGRLHKSTDGGITWPVVVAGADGVCGGLCLYSQALAVDPGDPNKVYLGGSGPGTCSSIFKRSSDGTSFAESASSLHAYSHAVAVAPSNPSVLYAGSDGGIWKSTDAGASWTSRNTAGFNATLFTSVALHPSDPAFTLGGALGQGTNLRSGAGSWVRADFGDGGAALIDPQAADSSSVTMYHTYFNVVDGGAPGTGFLGLARVSRTACAADGEWVFRGCNTSDASTGCEGAPRGASNGLSCSDTAVLFFPPMALGPGAPGGPATLYFGTDKLYRSPDGGDTMVPVSQTFEAGVPVSAIGISALEDGLRIAGLKNGRLFVTRAGASPMLEITGPWPRVFVARAVIDPKNSSTAYVTLSGFGLPAAQHIWKTTNLGVQLPVWSPAGSGIPDVPVNAFAVDPLESKHLYAGTDIGVFYSPDAGATWSLLGAGLPRVPVFDLAVQDANRVVRVATHGRGVWELAAPVPVELVSFTAD